MTYTMTTDDEREGKAMVKWKDYWLALFEWEERMRNLEVDDMVWDAWSALLEQYDITLEELD